MSWYQKACALKKDGNFQEAEAVLTKLIQQHEQQYGQDKDCLNYMDLRSECLVGIGKVTEAEQCFRSNLDRWNVLGGHLGKGKAARMRLEIGKCIRLQCEASKAVTEDSQMVITPSTKERYRECQKLFEEAIEEWKSLEPRQHKRIFQALINLSDTLDQLAEIAEENNAMEEALSLRVKAIKCDREALQYAKLKQTACTERTIAQCQWDLAQSLLKASERQEAKSVLVKLLAYMQEQRTTGKPLKDLDFNEKECQEWIKDCDAATETLRHVVEVWPRRFSVNHTRKRHHKRWMALIRTAIVNFWMNKLYFVIQQTVSDPDERADYLEAFKRRSFPRSPETLIRKEGFNRTRQPNLREQKASTNEGTQHDEFDEEHEQGALFNSGKVPNASAAVSHDWLKKFKKFCDAVREHIGDPGPTIKVAMLDSGIDPDHPYIKKMWTQERDGGSYRDFVGVDPTPCDRDGHGTHCAGIILQHAPEVSLYIGRVVDTQKSCLKDRSLHHKVEKALEWALQEVKADIVSMSFGLPWEAPGISNLILKNLVSTTFVAAAANSGSSEPVAFPASESTVLCMHACGGNGKPSLFTPPVQSYNNNFMVLGERVPSCWPSTQPIDAEDELGAQTKPKLGCWKYSDGTSVATPLAVSLIAILKAYVKDNETRLGGGFTHSSLRKVLKEISTVVEGYQHLTPWRLDGKLSNYKNPDEFFRDIKRIVIPLGRPSTKLANAHSSMG